MKRKVLLKQALLAAAFFTGLSTNAQSINAWGGQSQTISSDQTCTSFSVLDGSTLTVNQGVTLTLSISNGNNFSFFDNSTLQLHGTLAGSVASGATWMDNTYINVYLSDGAKYTVTGLSCMDGDNYLRYYGYDAATDGNGTVSVTSGSTAVTASSIGYRTTTYTFTATPASGYRFVNWTKGAGGEVLGTDASINVTCEQNGTYQVYANFEEDAPAGTALTPDATRKVWTLDAMPGGNVTLEPDYYPQATVAEGAVTAADADARATTDDPLVKVDATKLTGAKKLMYYVSTDATAPAYDAEGWTDVLPTAENYTEAATLNVWYYPVGTDEGVDEATATYSDGDICATALTVSLAAAPLWNAEFDLTNAPEEDKAGKWSTDIPEGGVVKGTEVTVTYTGSKKIIGVKAEKKAAAPASTTLDNTIKAWTAGTYAVPAGGLTYSDAITVSGDVTLTLTDGETLTLNKGISLAEGATLTVEGNGTMNINGTNGSTASTVAGTGTLVLTSGTLTATGGNGGSVGNESDESHGGNGGVAINGSVIVSDGTLTARGGNGGSVGNDCWDCTAGKGGDAISGTLTINGGSTSVNNGSNGSIGSYGVGNTAGKGGKAVAGTVTDNR